jgi:hypothetical protein
VLPPMMASQTSPNQAQSLVSRSEQQKRVWRRRQLRLQQMPLLQRRPMRCPLAVRLAALQAAEPQHPGLQSRQAGRQQVQRLQGTHRNTTLRSKGTRHSFR